MTNCHYIIIHKNCIMNEKITENSAKKFDRIKKYRV